MSMQISLIFQPNFKEKIKFNFLYFVKLQSPLTKDTDEGKDFIKTFVFLQTYYWPKGLN